MNVVRMRCLSPTAPHLCMRHFAGSGCQAMALFEVGTLAARLRGLYHMNMCFHIQTTGNLTYPSVYGSFKSMSFSLLQYYRAGNGSFFAMCRPRDKVRITASQLEDEGDQGALAANILRGANACCHCGSNQGSVVSMGMSKELDPTCSGSFGFPLNQPQKGTLKTKNTPHIGCFTLLARPLRFPSQLAVQCGTDISIPAAHMHTLPNGPAAESLVQAAATARARASPGSLPATCRWEVASRNAASPFASVPWQN